jgi:putative copper resistance protein D
MAEAGLIVSRFVHFAAVLLLFGMAAFPLYAFKEGESKSPSGILAAQLRPLTIVAAVAVFTSAVTWLAFTAANMSGSLANAVSPTIISLVIEQTDFGRIWIWRIALAAVLVFLFALKTRADSLALLRTAGAALLLTSIGGTGHSGATPGTLGTVHVAADSLHLLAASAWIGGLIPLMRILSAKTVDDAFALSILNRFSSMAILAVAALVASGIVNSVMILNSLSALTGTTYGWVLIAKILMFLGMMHFAVNNKFKLVPSLAGKANGEPIRQRLNGNITAELALVTLVLAAVALLGTLSPSQE